MFSASDELEYDRNIITKVVFFLYSTDIHYGVNKKNDSQTNNPNVFKAIEGFKTFFCDYVIKFNI